MTGYVVVIVTVQLKVKQYLIVHPPGVYVRNCTGQYICMYYTYIICRSSFRT